MKKIFLLAIAAFMFTTGMQAQIVRSQSTSIQREKTPSNTQWYMRLGVGLAKWTGDDADDYAASVLDDEDAKIKSKAGYDFMFGFHKPIGNSSLYWGMEFGLGSRGYKVNGKWTEDYYVKANGEYTEKLTAHNIKIVPFQLGYKVDLGHDISIDPHLGVFVSADYTGKLSWKDEGVEDGDKFKEEDDYNISDFSFTNEDGDEVDYQRVDVGLQVGVGVWFKNFNLDFTYQRGFMPVWTDTKLYNSQFMIRVGFGF